jgi:hypothetical protein
MGPTRKRIVSHGDAAEQEVREHEVLRANKELSAYFKGQRTEREARAALRIIKAFIRDREHIAPADRRPLPGSAPAHAAPAPKPKKTARPPKVRRRPRRQAPRHGPAVAPEPELINPPVHSNG